MQFTQRRLIAGGTFVAALVLVVVSFVVADALHTSRAPAHIRIEATPIVSFDTRDPSRTRFGALEFLAVTDNGSWLRGRIVYRGGRPAGIADAEMAPMLGPDGKPLFERGWYDAESLTLGNDGLYYVGIERVEKIVRFDYRRDGFAARAQEVPVPGDFKTFTYNKSLECLASPPRGSPKADDLIVVTEHSLDAAGNHRAYLLNGAHVVRFSVKRTDDFDVSDCTVLAPDDPLLLERRFWVARGIAVRIRRLRLDDMKQDALVDGPTVLEADLAYQIDNMEGIAVTRNAQGETIITLVSDDNFSPIQRNLLLQFALVEH